MVMVVSVSVVAACLPKCVFSDVVEKWLLTMLKISLCFEHVCC